MNAALKAGVALKPHRTAFCRTCKLKHYAPHATNEAAEFVARHVRRGCAGVGVTDEVDPSLHRLHLVTGRTLFRRMKEQIVRGLKIVTFALFALRADGIEHYAGNASITETFGTATAFTITNANLTNSATAGWKSNAIDNSTNLYDDALVHAVLASAAWTADKAIYYFAHGLVDGSGTLYTSTGDGTPDGSEGTMTFPDVTAHTIVAPLLGIIPTPVTSKALNGGPWSVAACFRGILPPKWCISALNQGGATLSVTSIKYIELKYTVA